MAQHYILICNLNLAPNYETKVQYQILLQLHNIRDCLSLKYTWPSAIFKIQRWVFGLFVRSLGRVCIRK